MKANISKVCADDSGVAMVEYALIMALVSLLSYGILMAIGGALEQFFISSSTGLGYVAQYPQ